MLRWTHSCNNDFCAHKFSELCVNRSNFHTTKICDKPFAGSKEIELQVVQRNSDQRTESNSLPHGPILR